LKAFENGVIEGRGGLGSIYVFATGNGGEYDDNWFVNSFTQAIQFQSYTYQYFFDENSNFDGYSNSIYTISIGALDRNNNHPKYSELCAAMLGVTYSSNDKAAIVSSFLMYFKLSY
jgi:kexin